MSRELYRLCMVFRHYYFFKLSGMNQLRKTGHTISYLFLSHNSVSGIQITGNEIREKLYRMLMFFYIFFLF